MFRIKRYFSSIGSLDMDTTLLYSERLFAASLYIINNILANRITSFYEHLPHSF